MVQWGLPAIISKPALKNCGKKAVEIANALLKVGLEEGTAIATGIKLARECFETERSGSANDQQDAD